MFCTHKVRKGQLPSLHFLFHSDLCRQRLINLRFVQKLLFERRPPRVLSFFNRLTLVVEVIVEIQPIFEFRYYKIRPKSWIAHRLEISEKIKNTFRKQTSGKKRLPQPSDPIHVYSLWSPSATAASMMRWAYRSVTYITITEIIWYMKLCDNN